MLFPARIVKPAELALLTRVCRTICEERSLQSSGPAAEAIASHLLTLYLYGLNSEDALLSAERNREHRLGVASGARGAQITS